MHLSFDARKNDIEIKQKQKELEEEKDELKKELVQIELDQKTYSKATMQLVAAHRMREVTEWSNFKKIYKEFIDSESDICLNLIDNLKFSYRVIISSVSFK